MAFAAIENGPSTRDDPLRRVKREFLAGLHHELRTPLSSILGMTDLLLETSLNERQIEYVDATRTCAEELLEQLNTALEFSALESGHVSLHESEFNLVELLGSVAGEYGERAVEKGLEFALTLSEDLPTGVCGDSVRLSQMISRILANAVKFTVEGRIAFRAEAGPILAGRFQLLIEVSDTGIGIAPDQLQVVFESFRRGEGAPARRYPGLGLGLALVHRLVHLMHGKVTVESEPGRGSILCLHIPLRVFNLASLTAAPVRKPAARRHSLLVMDADPASRQEIAHMLSRREYDVRTVPHGPAALAEAGRRRYDVVIMDLDTLEVDGLEAVRKLRKLRGYAEVPIIAHTSRSDDAWRASCLENGVRVLLEKPLGIQKLLTALDPLL